MGYPNQPPQGGGSYQQYLPPGQQPGQQPPQPGYPQPGVAQGYPQPGYPQQPPQQGYPAPQGAYGPAPVDFLQAFGQADLTAGGPPIPGGNYTAVIAEPADFGPTSAGDKSMWTVKLKIDGGEHAGRGLTKRIVISPESPKAMGMMYRQVSALTGLPVPEPENPGAQQNSHWQQGGPYLATLMRPGTPVDLEVTLKPRNDDPTRMTNDVDMIHPRGTRTGQQQAQPGPAAVPAQPQPQPQPAQQQAQPNPYQAAPGPDYGQQQAAQPHQGGTAEFAPPQQAPQGIGQQAGQNGQPPAQPQQPGTLPAPPWQQG